MEFAKLPEVAQLSSARRQSSYFGRAQLCRSGRASACRAPARGRFQLCRVKAYGARKGNGCDWMSCCVPASSDPNIVARNVTRKVCLISILHTGQKVIQSFLLVCCKHVHASYTRVLTANAAMVVSACVVRWGSCQVVCVHCKEHL